MKSTLSPRQTTLSVEDVKAIKASTLAKKELQHLYGVSKVTIWQIQTGRAWKWVE